MSYKSKYIFIYHLGHILKCKKASQIAAYGQFNSLDTLIFFCCWSEPQSESKCPPVTTKEYQELGDQCCLQCQVCHI